MPSPASLAGRSSSNQRPPLSRPPEVSLPETNVFPVIERRYEPAPDLDDRLRRIYALLSLLPLPF